MAKGSGVLVLGQGSRYTCNVVNTHYLFKHLLFYNILGIKQVNQMHDVVLPKLGNAWPQSQGYWYWGGGGSIGHIVNSLKKTTLFSLVMGI